MMCYKDMTFCSAICFNRECPRRITKDVLNESARMELPLSITNFKDGCDDYIPLKEDEDGDWVS